MTAVVFSIAIFCGVDNALPQILGGKVATIPGFIHKVPMLLLFIHPKQQPVKLFLPSMRISHWKDLPLFMKHMCKVNRDGICSAVYCRAVV